MEIRDVYESMSYIINRINKIREVYLVFMIECKKYELYYCFLIDCVSIFNNLYCLKERKKKCC